jgi:hypothetical protein
MRRAVWLAGAALVVSSTLALASPESLLPPSFQAPAPTPAPRAAPAPSAARPGPAAAQPSVPSASSGSSTSAVPTPPPVQVKLPANLPSIEELEKMDPDELDALFGLKPKYDVPPGAQRSLLRIGVLDEAEGGFPALSLTGQPAALVRAALAGTKQPLVSRWGHILLRRALASRLDAPQGMDPVEFAALRAQVLNRLGEASTARALVQDVDSANFDPALGAAALDAYLTSGDLLGICPVTELKGKLLDTPEWQMSQMICRAYAGGSRDAEQQLDRALYYGLAPRVDVLLAQRFAGAAGETRRDITIEWNGVNELNKWRFSLARTLGVDVPDNLRKNADRSFDFADVQIPAVSLTDRVAAADRAAARGTLSSASRVDLYSQLWADDGIDDSAKGPANTLRDAYVAREASDRVAAMRTLWGNGDDYGAQVLTAYAAARLPVSKDFLDDAPRLVGSMLTAGLDRNAMRWGQLVPQGSLAWGILVLAQPQRSAAASSGAVSDFVDDDNSSGQRKSKFLVAGLSALGRLDANSAAGFARDLKFDLAGQTVWTRKIERAADVGNPTLVALLAGLGMQGDSWARMTPRHLYHIVRALDRVGLDAEARMIAAEAVARG